MKDRIYAQPRDRVDDFTFNDAVARVFPDMIERSVPGYAGMLEMLGLLAGSHLRTGDRCYDLGCSRGAASLVLAGLPMGGRLQIIAVDNASAMIERLQSLLDRQLPEAGIQPRCQDIRDIRVQGAALVVLNLTLQFIPRGQRLELLSRIHAGMLPGAMLFLSEKLRFDDAKEQARMDRLQEDFKRAKGYSELEIAQKRAALEKVLLPDTENQHRQRLKQAGFQEAHTVFRCLNFASFVAYA